jgi:hypothetical protein
MTAEELMDVAETVVRNSSTREFAPEAKEAAVKAAQLQQQRNLSENACKMAFTEALKTHSVPK